MWCTRTIPAILTAAVGLAALTAMAQMIGRGLPPWCWGWAGLWVLVAGRSSWELWRGELRAAPTSPGLIRDVVGVVDRPHVEEQIGDR